MESSISFVSKDSKTYNSVYLYAKTQFHASLVPKLLTLYRLAHTGYHSSNAIRVLELIADRVIRLS